MNSQITSGYESKYKYIYKSILEVSAIGEYKKFLKIFVFRKYKKILDSFIKLLKTLFLREYKSFRFFYKVGQNFCFER